MANCVRLLPRRLRRIGFASTASTSSRSAVSFYEIIIFLFLFYFLFSVTMAFQCPNNAIITGLIDAYCLVCESHLRSGDDVHYHIAKPIHIKNRDSTGYFGKYKDDCVRKVSKQKFFIT